MQKFLYFIERKEEETHIEFNLYFVNEKSEKIIEKTTQNYLLFVRKDAYENLNLKSDNIVLSEQEFFSKKGDKVVLLEVKNKELYLYLIKTLKEDQNPAIFEADLPLEHAYVIHNNVKVNTLKTITNKTLSYISLDIETIGENMQNQEIVLISTYSPHVQCSKVYVNSEKISQSELKNLKKHKFEEFKTVFCDTEKEVLESFKTDITMLNPTILLGWNVVDFDFNVIKQRMKHYSIPFSFTQDNEEGKLKLSSDFFKSSTLTFPGIIVFDVIQLLKINFISFEDYKLNTVAQEVLKDTKISLTEDEDIIDDESIDNKIEAIARMLSKNPLKLIEYNFKDSYLTAQIVEKLNLIELMCKRSALTNTLLNKVRSPIASLDNLYLPKLHTQGQVASTNFNFQDSTPIEGAFVLDPIAGFYENVFVFDFKSLYPSIIMTFNIDPFTFNHKGTIKAPNDAHFEAKPGILPSIILELYKERDNAKWEKDLVKSFALKTTMNAFYGAVASPKSRFYNKEIGEAITSFGRFIIQKAKGYLEKLGHQVIYGDTDSVFVHTKHTFSSLTEKEKVGREIEAKLNKYFKEWVETEFKQECFLSIKMEKIFSKFFIASKKRYVGFDELTHELMFTGMEYVRGDWTDLAKQFQKELVEKIFANATKDELKIFIKSYIDTIKKGTYDNLLEYRKKITKGLSEYTKTTPPHVKAAREVPNFQGRLVRYIMTKDGPKHISLITKNSQLDYDHYIEKQLKGVSDDLLLPLGIDFDQVRNEKKQGNLNKFF
jgi:DNA polymerase-2